MRKVNITHTFKRSMTLSSRKSNARISLPVAITRMWIIGGSFAISCLYGYNMLQLHLYKTHETITTAKVDSNDLNAKEEWIPLNPWEPPPDYLFTKDETGSNRNCTGFSSHYSTTNTTAQERYEDSGTIVISCHEILYRAPLDTFQNAGDLVIGVLSTANGTGPERRNVIRETWGYEFPGLVFLVAGPWDSIEKEYTFYKDMIWIDEDEIYQGETSVLTYKTVSFFTIAHKLSPRAENGGFVHAIKTDDDSYVNIEAIKELLRDEVQSHRLHYWGHCPKYQVAPLRDPKLKWAISYQLYPEPMFPLYCQGAGFGLSRKLLECAVDTNHVSNFRYNPFEDVSIGIVVERCGYTPTMVTGVKVFRADTKEERDRVNMNGKATDQKWQPIATMKGKIIQHRVETREDMINHHSSLGLTTHRVKKMA